MGLRSGEVGKLSLDFGPEHDCCRLAHVAALLEQGGQQI